MNLWIRHSLVAAGVVVFAAGVHLTYERYRGSDLSRVPRTTRAGRVVEEADREVESAEARSTVATLASAALTATLGGEARAASTQSALQPGVSAVAVSADAGIPGNAARDARPNSAIEDPLGDVTGQLTLYPTIEKGMRTPFDLWRYYGRGACSFNTPVLPMRFEQWLEFHAKQKPQLMEDLRAYMGSRFDFSGTAIPGATMSGGKPVMQGPIARLPGDIATFEQLASLPAREIRERDCFPYKPLSHPLQSTAHMLFPPEWIKAHPEHQRIDVDMDIPTEYLPEFPPPLFLTTHRELGDISRGQEITLDNYYEIFDGLLTPEQMEGLKELLRPSPTTWFNQTEHRLTVKPSKGVACMDCHVNGHTNAAVELGPDSRPNMGRLRTDTPTLRGNYNLVQLSSKRSIRSMDHFAEVEEYFDGDPGMQQAIGPRGVQRTVTNRMADFNALIDYPPAPKLDPLMRLDPLLATEAELRGEALFQGKAQCAKCHYGPAFVDDYMHDLKVERFYVGRPEGPIKTFPLRGIKDSPPYLHDGRCPTLHDAVEFFDLVLGLKLTRAEKEDLVAYLLCL
jgi:cytochrome c peroxidase